MLQKVLIIDDNLPDARAAANVAKELGTKQVETISRFGKGVFAFDQIVEGKRPAPDLLILDLDFGLETGFDLLRVWNLIRRRSPERGWWCGR